MVISAEDYYSMPIFKTSDIRENGNLLYKCSLYSNTYANFVKKLTRIPVIKGLILPISTFTLDGTNYKYKIAYRNGYTMSKITSAINIDEFLKKPYDIDPISIITNIYHTLNKAHEYITIGDIRNANILLKGTKVYFCDLENGGMQNEFSNSPTYYTIDDIYEQSSTLDFCKAFICSLSLYYKIDLEGLFFWCGNINSSDILRMLNIIKANPLIINYFEELIDNLHNNPSIPTPDFSDYLKEIGLPKEKEIKRIRKYVDKTRR